MESDRSAFGVTPSFRLRAASTVARYTVKPWLRRSKDPVKAEGGLNLITKFALTAPYVCHTQREIGAVPTHWFRTVASKSDQLCIYFHGGGYLAGSGYTHRGMLGRLARLSGVEIAAPDYRLLQYAPFPAAVEDAIAVWDGAMSLGFKPDHIVLGGDSAGGGLAFALLAALCARGTPPAGTFGFSPWLDQTGMGETAVSNADAEAILPAERMSELAQMYLVEADPSDPRASPLFADFSGVSPVWLQAAKGEILRSDSERMAAKLKAQNADVDLQLWPGALHVWQLLDGMVPEARAALTQTAGFIQKCLPAENR